MKKILFIILFFLIWFNISYWYENQGFLNYKEENWIVNFQCEKQCFIFIWSKENNNILYIKWNIIWNWVVWYWFLNWQQIIPGEFSNIKNNISLENKFFFNKLQYYNQLPNEIITILIIDWNLKSDNFSFILDKSNFIDNLKLNFDNFIKIETLTPYSINLRYWIMIWWISIVKIWYIIFILIWIFFLLNKKYKKFNNFLLLGLTIFLFIWFRNLYTYYDITKTWLKSYTFESIDNKTFFDLWDYITFTDKVRKTLYLDDKNNKKDCRIFIDSFQDWPFKAHWQSVYLKPCQIVDDISKAEYLMYYKENIPNEIKWEKLIDFNNSYLYILTK